MSGVCDTGVVDLITSLGNQAKLIMVESREWDSDDNMYRELQEKINHYLIYIEDGQMVRDYPDLSDSTVTIQLDSLYEPSEYASCLMTRISEVLQERDIEFMFNKIEA